MNCLRTSENINHFVDLVAETRPLWDMEFVLGLVEKASSPQEAYEEVLHLTGDTDLAHAARMYRYVTLRNPFMSEAAILWFRQKKDGTKEELKNFMVRNLRSH